MAFGSFFVSDTLFDLLADVSHLGLVFSVHISSSFAGGLRALGLHRRSFLLSRVACVVTRSSSVSVSPFVIAFVIRMLLFEYFCHIFCCCLVTCCCSFSSSYVAVVAGAVFNRVLLESSASSFVAVVVRVLSFRCFRLFLSCCRRRRYVFPPKCF